MSSSELRAYINFTRLTKPSKSHQLELVYHENYPLVSHVYLIHPVLSYLLPEFIDHPLGWEGLPPHRCKVLFLGACLDPGAPVMFVTEYMPRGPDRRLRMWPSDGKMRGFHVERWQNKYGMTMHAWDMVGIEWDIWSSHGYSLISW